MAFYAIFREPFSLTMAHSRGTGRWCMLALAAVLPLPPAEEMETFDGNDDGHDEPIAVVAFGA
jgi:hypothetical protein